MRTQRLYGGSIRCDMDRRDVVTAMSVRDADIARMRDQLFFEGPERSRKISKFWMLLILSGIIAAAGVTADSTATVIGAMIVAPLMTPILGVVLAIVLADRANLGRSLFTVVAGATVVVAVGWVVGLIVPYAVVAQTNAQVASRVDPRLIDLLAALATGAVGSIALVRSDISDTLPGVAIAISLVPPLSVVGLTLQSGAPHQSVGALLLFVTNVTAILFSGVVVMAIYRVYGHTRQSGGNTGYFRRKGSTVAVVALVALVVVPLAITSSQATTSSLDQAKVQTIVDPWAQAAGWTVVDINPRPDGIYVRATGPLPEPATAGLRSALNAQGLRGTPVFMELIPGTVVQLGAR